MDSFPGSRNKMRSFIETRDVHGAVNPHGPSSPPRPGAASAAAAAAASTSSPLGRKKGKTGLEAMKLSLPEFDGSKPPNGTMNPPGTPQIKRSASQRQGEVRAGWDSAPPIVDHDDEVGGGLREIWEEQSNIHSLFSESAPTRPTSRQTGRDVDDDNQSTQSDVLAARPRPQRGRNGHKASESSNFVGRHQSKLQLPDRRPYIEVKDGRFSFPGQETKGFSTSLITHAPRNSMPEAHDYRQDPFGTTSEEGSPQGDFIHSSFPYRQGGRAKAPTHIQRAAFHMDAVRKLSPEKYDATMGAGHLQTYPKTNHEPSMQNPPSFYAPDNHQLRADSDANDSDIPSQEDELVQQQQTPKATRKRAAVQDDTIVLDPPKPVMAQNPHRAVVIQDAALSGSPMARLPASRQPSQKKRRLSIDYDDAALQRMSFAELQNEPFDHDPTREVAQSPAKPPADNLDNRLRFYQSKDENVQAQFFTQMSVRDWEESGDWFLEQFGNIVKKMRGARQAKRNMVESFENEISNREEAVRHKKESIDRRLSKLKQDGDAMMKGKELDE